MVKKKETMEKKMNKDSEQEKRFEIRGNVISDEDYKKSLTNTLEYITKILLKSLGPYGSTTVIQDRFLNHIITKDGYTILKHIYIDNIEGRSLLDFVRKISRRLVRKVGDGSTSSIIISNYLFRNFKSLMKKYNIPPKDLLDILDDISEEVIERIRWYSIPISEDLKEIEYIARISTNNNYEYGRLLKEIFQKIGKYGFINLETSKTNETYYDITRGFELPRGYIDTLMCNKITEKVCEFIEPVVFMCDDVLREEDIPGLSITINTVCNQLGRPIVFLARGYDNSVATFFHVNIMKIKLPILAVELTLGTQKYQDRFEDICLTLGCTPYLKSEGDKLEPDKCYPMDRFGCCNRVISTENSTKIIEGRGDKKKIEEKVKFLSDKVEELYKRETILEMDDEIFQLRKRISLLENSMCILYIGGTTEENKSVDRYLLEDAVFACRSGMKHGYIIGGNLVIPFLLGESEIKKNIQNKLFDNEKYQFTKDSKVLDKDKFLSLTNELMDMIHESFVSSYFHVLNNRFQDPEYCDQIIVDCLKDKKILNLKTDLYESRMSENLTVINSSETDIEILKSSTSIIGLLLTSNQFISLPENIKKD